MVDWWKVGLGIGAIGGLIGLAVALSRQPSSPPPLGMTVDGSTEPPELPCGGTHTLAAVGGTPNGAAEFVSSPTPAPSRLLQWGACPACFKGSFDSNGNFSTSVVLVTGPVASTFYVAIYDVASGKYSSWIPVTVLAQC